VSGVEVPIKRTAWTNAGLLEAYATAWAIVIGGEAPRHALALLWAQACIECGHEGYPGCFNWNVGNLMHFDPREGSYHVLHGAPECGTPGALPAGAIQIAPSATSIKCAPGKVPYLPEKGSRFRAYASFVEGCTDKLRVLDRQWPRAIVALQTATDLTAAGRFVSGLVGPPRYMTASEVSYGASLRSLMADCLKKTAEQDWPRARSIPDTDPAPAPPDSDPTWPGTPDAKAKSGDQWRAVTPEAEPEFVSDFLRSLATPDFEDPEPKA
jgi:hypothetical protein